MRISPVTLFTRVAAAAACVLVFGGALEACARVDDYLSYGAPLLSNYRMEDLLEDSGGSIGGKPGARFEKWKLNNRGLQGPEVPAQKQPGRLRVLVLGASESFGLYESPGKAYPAQLQEVLAQRLGRPVEVLNGALPGMSLPRVIHFCENRLAALQPDVVIYYPTPASYLDESAPSLQVKRVPPQSKRPQPRILRRGWQVVKSAAPTPVQDWLRNREIVRATRGQEPGWLYREVPEDRVELFRGHLELLARRVRAAGVSLVLATHANRFHPPISPADERWLLSWRVYYPRAEGKVLLAMERRANEVIRDVAREQGLPLTDIASAVGPDPRNFADFAHFTDAGSRQAAQALGDTVIGLRTEQERGGGAVIASDAGGRRLTSSR